MPLIIPPTGPLPPVGPGTFIAGSTRLLLGSATHGVGLRRVEHGATPLFVDLAGSAPLWSIRLLHPTAADRTVENGHALTAKSTPTGAAWKGFAGLPGASVQLLVESVGDELHLRLGVRVPPPWSVATVDFPVTRLHPTPGPETDTTLLFTVGAGRYYPAPFTGPVGYETGADDLPQPATMQFGALLHGGGFGLYWATHDPTGRPKRFKTTPIADPASPTRRAIELRIRHFAENARTPGNGWGSPYPVVLRTFDGDWWDAAMIYRQWALTAPWSAKGPVRTRTDLAPAVRRAAVWTTLNTRCAEEGVCTDSLGNPVRVPADDWRESLTRYQDLLGTPVAVHWYGWHCSFDSLSETQGWTRLIRAAPQPPVAVLAGQLKAAGVTTAPYLNSLAWHPSAPEYQAVGGDALAIRDEAGKIAGEPDSGAPIVCASETAFHLGLAGTASALLAAGMGGIYLDQIGRQVDYPCWSSGHGHSVSGGDYAFKGVRELLTAVRGVTAPAGAPLVGEDPAESWTDLLDGRLETKSITKYGLPLWAAVYGDYLPSFGRRLDLEEPPGDDWDARARIAALLLRGAALGRIASGTYETSWGWFNPAHASTLELLQAAIAHRRQFASYVVEGHLQRSVTVDDDAPPIHVLDDFDPNNRPMTVRSVQAACWTDGAGSGRLGLLVVNLRPTPVDAEIQVDLTRFEIRQSPRYVVRRVPLTGAPVSRKSPPGVVERRTLARNEVVFFDIIAIPFPLP